jgi:ribosomal protein S12 methylthiotransferase
VDGDVADRRRDAIMSAQQAISASLCASKIGTSVEVIIEGYDEDEFCYVGRSSTDTPDVDGAAYVYSEEELMAGDIVTAEVIDANEYDIITKVGGQNI